ncbi:hypothetical protein M409DRAFT_66010 [Zasmidium cellare ATCC 36951]|uniref:NmrA-like domain-containing protein n=1 Tax=Zasmidium cellare ATCC 36951 TaxID=1080233 RepID=A0A6A6CL55_ZASCE|nr:uncharacterized protein M409DRAFT_66010 [Zasmidium cellare ATCC 36951]KAF2167353.1 hypothetical protein M409DRAFT_66010 [Zasmidium cellare ATCC 36951]
MYAIIGAAGKVGYATAQVLRQANVPVRAILRDAAKATPLREIGCEIAVADVHNTSELASAIRNAEAVHVIIPPSPQHKDGAQDMRDIITSIIAALEQEKPNRILAISDYGSHVARDIGMPTVFRGLEERLRNLPGNKIILRTAEHMQNWARAIPAAMESGTFVSLHDPLDTPFPTISAPDLGKIAAEVLLRDAAGEKYDIVHAEGPRRYSANDVAAALSDLSGRPIKAVALPRSEWQTAIERGASPSLATLLVKANYAQNEAGVVDVEQGAGEVRYGKTELIDALRPFVSP